MIVKHHAAALWEKPVSDIAARLEQALDKGLTNAAKPVRVFFRADDVAAPGANWNQLLTLHLDLGAPLCPAIVPAWLTQDRWQVISALAGQGNELLSWHQHGWKHKNHETQGKKWEFGPGRDMEQKRADLARGMLRLRTIIGGQAERVPVFTPPWNRIDEQGTRALVDLGFVAVSRSTGAKPDLGAILPDLPVGVDLHTRKEEDPEAGFAAMLEEMTGCLASGLCGFMIHHQRMNNAAFDFHRLLLESLRKRKGVEMFGFREL